MVVSPTEGVFMHQVTTDARVVGGQELDEQFVVTFSRGELEALRDSGDPAQLWLELEQEGSNDSKRLSIDLTSSDIEQLLQHPNGDDLLIALDSYALNGLFDDAEVEAHGLRTALAIAVVAATAAAPAGLAATPQTASAQTVGAATTTQVNPAASAQYVSAAAQPQVAAQVSAQVSTQVSKPAAKAQVSTAAAKAQISKAAALPQVSNAMAKAQISRTLILKAHGISLFRQANT
jgi:hypothetical protein